MLPSDLQAKDLPCVDSDGKVLFAVEERSGKIIFYFRTEKDIDLLLQRLVTTGNTDKFDRDKMLLSNCGRSGGGPCLGDCTGGGVCRGFTHVTPEGQILVCDC